MERDLQRIHVKMLAEAPADLSLDPFLAIFGRWRNDTDHPATWVDLADYAHMPTGAGIVLIGKQGNFGINTDPPGLGLLYGGKKDFEGTIEHRILEAFRRCLELLEPLLAEPDYPRELRLNPGAWEIFINDRLDFPNTDETDGLLRAPAQKALDRLFGANHYGARRETDPERRYALSVRVDPAPDLNTLFEQIKTGVA